MLLLIIMCFVSEYENVLLSAHTIACEDGVELYLQEERLIQVRRDPSKAHMQIQACTTDRSVVLEQFDPGHMLQNISSIEIQSVDWSILNYDTSKLTNVAIIDLTSFGVWRDCSRLDYLFVAKNKKHFNMLTILPDWLKNCTRIRQLRLRFFSILEIRLILQSALSVQTLYLNSIRDLPRIVQYPLFSSIRNKYRRLTDLNLDANATADLPVNLTWANVSANLVGQVASLPLVLLSVSGMWFDLCASGNFSSVKMASLKSLFLFNTNTGRLCFKKYLLMPQLTEIIQNNLGSSPGFKLQIGQLFSTQSPQILLDLNNHGQVSSFQFTRDDYLALSDISNKVPKKANLTLIGFRQLIKCDCTGASWWFARAIRAGLITAPGVMCDDYRAPKELECEWMDCERISCNSTCVCCRERKHEISVDCRGANLLTLPVDLLHLPNLTRLIAPRNNITTLPDQLPDNIVWVDFSGNNIWHAGAGKVAELFTYPLRHVRLAGNYILCLCDHKTLINTLQDKSQQIEDYASITCAVTGTKLEDVNVSQLCASRDHDKALIKNRETILIVVMTTLLLAAAGITLAIVLYHRRHEFQIYLFARGWCLCCVTEEELDADRCYDVFVSFCHEDTTLVLTELLPSLDRDYSVCIHLRDWCPGEMIPSQITKSVQQSRRTLVVMSRNFVHSIWGRLEFQTAHVSGLADGRVRVVMIILDDVLEREELAPEMRSYVRLNTYVRWDDPWFWEKLRYALPHHPSPLSQTVRLQIDCSPLETHDRNIEMKAIEWQEQSQ